MKVQDLMALLEAVPAEDEIVLALSLENGRKVEAKLAGLARRRVSPTLLLAASVYRPLIDDPFQPGYRIKP